VVPRTARVGGDDLTIRCGRAFMSMHQESFAGLNRATIGASHLVAAVSNINAWGFSTRANQDDAFRSEVFLPIGSRGAR